MHQHDIRLFYDLVNEAGFGGVERSIIQPRYNKNKIPLTFGQERIWFMNNLVPGSSLFNIPLSIRLKGALKVAPLELAINQIIERHDVLRTKIETIDGQARQVLHTAIPFKLPILDLRNDSGKAQDKKFRQTALEASTKPFRLEEDRLLRVLLVKYSASFHILVIVMHHIISDGWSFSIFFQELSTIYNALVRDQPIQLDHLSVQFSDYALWQRENAQHTKIQENLSYWKNQLKDIQPLELVSDRPRPPIQTYSGLHHTFTLPAGLSAKLKILTNEHKTTTFSTLLSAFFILLYRYTGQNDLCVGSPVAGRAPSEIEANIGCFINNIVIRAKLEASMNFIDLIRAVHQVNADAQSHQEIPFEMLVSELEPDRDLSRSPLFQVMFILQSKPLKPAPLMDIEMEFEEIENKTSKYDITLSMEEHQNQIRGWFEYNTDLFNASTIIRLTKHYVKLLESIILNPYDQITKLPLLSDAEKKKIMVQLNDTAIAYTPFETVHTIIDDQVEKTPDATALVYDDQTLSYRDFSRKTNQLARYLQKKGITKEIAVAVLLERSVEMPLAIHGIGKAGGAYVPIDPNMPKDRILGLIEDVAPAVIITMEKFRPLLEQTHIDLIIAEHMQDTIAAESADRVECLVGPENMIYIIYTSGSTGKPKGTINLHKGLHNRLMWMQDVFKLNSSDRILQKTPYSFDVSVWEFFWPLMFGATLVVAKPDGHKDPNYLRSLIKEKRITTIHFVPTMLQAFLEVPDIRIACRSLKRVICSGEALSWSLQKNFFTKLDTDLFNLYGPTEASIDVTYWKCHQDDNMHIVPIGKPISNTQIYILDENLIPVPIGVPGELYIGGVNLARCYLNRPELTEKSFVPNPFQTPGADRLYKSGDKARFQEDGTIEYLGRLDNQVKIRGLRIELGEIEHHINAYEGIKECGVIDYRNKDSVSLVAYITLQKDAEVDWDVLKQYLNRILPEYMVPSLFMVLDELPISRHGKLDRKKLPEPQIDRIQISSTYQAPSTADEITLAEIWKEVLKTEKVGIHDSFFDLGGDSIRSIRVISEAKKKNISIELTELFQLRTISNILNRKKNHRNLIETNSKPLKPFELIDEADRSKIPDGIEDAYPATALQSGMLYHSKLNLSGENLYLIIFSFHLKIPLDVANLKQAIALLIQRYSVFRTSFDMSTYSTMMQLVHKTAETPLEVIDISNYSHKEQEIRIERMLEEEKKRKLDINKPPLIKFFVHIRSKESFQFTFNESHGILDGWSDTLIIKDLFMDYVSLLKSSKPAGLPVLKADYRDYVALELEAMNSERQKQFWAEKVSQSNYLKLPSLPTIMSPETTTWGEIIQQIDADVLAQANALAIKAQVPIKSVFFAAHYKLLQAYTGEKILTTGLVVNGRPEIPDGEKIPGLFLNTLPVTVEMKAENWFDFLKNVFAAEIEVWPYRRYPLPKLKGEKKASELFDICFNYNHFHTIEEIRAIKEIEHLDLKTSGQTNYPLSASFNRFPETGHMEIMLWFDPRIFNCEFVKCIGQCYVRILQQMTENPESLCVRTPILPKNQYDQIINMGSCLSKEYNPSYLPYQLFEKCAAENPDNQAVIFGNHHITYRELNQRANQFCHYLIANGIKPGDMVISSINRSINYIICTLGALKTGASVVPVDPGYPEQRVSYILEDTGAAIMVADNLENYSSIKEKYRIIDLTTELVRIFEEEDQNPPANSTATDRAYVIYTSGSTGKPKGVEISHGNLLNLVKFHVEYFGITDRDRASLIANVSFDASVWEVWPHLTSGASIYVVPPDIIGNRNQTKRWMVENEITRVFLPTPLAEDFILQEWSGTDNISIKTMLCGGDRLNYFAPESLPFELVNAYGPTENTVITTVGKVPLKRDAVSVLPTIGRPASYSLIYILDEYLQPVPVGVPGELCVSGKSLSSGYLGRPKLTNEKFIDHPFIPDGKLYRTGDICRWLPNGEIEFIGRKDDQVKIRGFRIELGEVKHLLEKHPQVRSALVLPKVDNNGIKRLVGFLEIHADQLFNKKYLTQVLDSRNGEVSDEDRESLKVAIQQLDDEQSTLNYEDDSNQPIRSRILKLLTEEVKDLLKKRAPHFMVPSELVPIQEFPLTANGKIDREALIRLASAEVNGIQKQIKLPKSDIEKRLLPIWQKALDLPKISVGDDFFEIGGDSLLALRIMAVIQEEFGFQIPISALIEAPTIEQFAQKLVSVNPANLWDLMVCVKKEGEGPPIFCVPGNGGNVLIFHWFAKYLNYGPIYAFQARGLDGVTEPYTTLEEMARDFIKEVKKVQKTGPYFFAGHSYGCKVIFEMMQVLKRHNEQVKLLLMFDTPDTILSDAPQGQDWGIERWMLDVVRRFNLFLPRLMKIKISHDHLKTLSATEQLTLFRDILVKCGVLKADAHINHIKGFLNVFAYGLKTDYRPKTHHQADKIILFKAKSRRDSLYYENVEDPKRIEIIDHTLNKDNTWGWEKFSKEPVSVFNVPGNHGTLLLPPFVHSTTKLLNQYFGRPKNRNHNFLQKIKDTYDVFFKSA